MLNMFIEKVTLFFVIVFVVINCLPDYTQAKIPLIGKSQLEWIAGVFTGDVNADAFV